MGIITISRIATQIIAVFSMDRDINTQFDFFNDVRSFPETIYVCLNKIDLLEGNKAQKDKKLQDIQKKINDFFQKRKININGVYMTCGETIEGFADIESYNNAVAEMILKICTSA